ncbi:MAG: bifunctional phosphopantothenoylcysteine decarboxylase/phosphopantothenate--cysteine ligase CoaBC [Alphaproteobacteria bacterium]|nr:bifunctional phosphopantothenoylcysteine decarboxylase/phosphopantothenate--cysteine ligase CoaBC [Alphaproteobacteria bacterium]MCB9931633.1 bifunctional phosphopantothenoylcysteine decarboxylase/phosphopantothenate--cysteine ligase CoaBC [Alphaproteobacteria bacterium]
MLNGKRILLIIAGGIAAYRSLDLIRRLRERGADVRCVLTRGGAEFVTPLSVAALSENKVYQDLFSLTDEAEMGHIRLSREADLLVVCPASADLLAKMAHGHADDLASTALLATDKPVMVCPTMNVMMWQHPATQANMLTLEARGVLRVGPGAGNLACGEIGTGRLAEVMDIVAAIEGFFAAEAAPKPLAGRHALVTSGPTWEAIDPVRYIANRSSGKQGHAIAAALARLGARTTLVSGPTAMADPAGVDVVRIESARQMHDACHAALPADIAVCAAAVADWRVDLDTDKKIKKDGKGPPPLPLVENPDILKSLGSLAANARPRLVVGFAAETGNVVAYARDKLGRKGCDWIVANDVSPGTGTFGGDDNTVHLVSANAVEDWPRMTKAQVADRLADRIAAQFGEALADAGRA